MTGEGGFATTDDDELADRHPPVPQPRHAGPLPPRGAGDELQAHGHRGGDRPRPARRASTSAPRSAAATRHRLSRRARRLPDADASRMGASTSGTSTRCASRASASAVLDGLAERGIGHASSTTRSRSIARRTSRRIVPGAADLDLPVTDRLADEVLSIPVRPNLDRRRARGVIDAVREVATPSSRPPPGSADDRAAARRARRAGLDGPQPPAPSLDSRGVRPSPRSPIRTPTARRRRRREDRARRLRPTRWR